VNVILGARGVAPERLAAVREAVVASGGNLIEQAGDGATWVASSTDGGAALHTLETPERHVVAFGSGAHTLRPTDLELDHLLDGCDDDLVAIGHGGGDLVVASGRGNHRLFVTSFPEGGSMVGSNLGLLARARGQDLAVDRGAEDFLLGFGFLPDGRTPFGDVSQLPAGQRATIEGLDDAAAVEPAVTADVPLVGGFDGAVDELHERFVRAVEVQAGGRTQHAVLLGGLDSALVAATLRRMGHDVATFTFGFGDRRYEQANVDELAAELGFDHTWIRMAPDRVFDGIERFRDPFPQPGPQPHYQVHTLIASEHVRSSGFHHVFSGDGCDAVFLGYPTVNARARIVAELGRIPRPVVGGLLRAAETGIADRHLGHVARMARSTLRSLQLPWPERGHLPTQYLDRHALDRLRGPDQPPQDEPLTEMRLRLARDAGQLDRTRLAFHGAGLTGQSRTKVDGAVTATGVAQRSPYLDPTLRSFVAALPTEFLRPAGTPSRSSGKALLVEMARRHRLLPDHIIDMPKQSPVDSPIDHWYPGELRGRVYALLEHLPFEVNHDYVDEMLRPKRAEDLFRERVSLAHHALQPIGLLCSYASFTQLAGH
jgi:asparagine synthetase B (glutamine-hydrolysing)